MSSKYFVTKPKPRSLKPHVAKICITCKNPVANANIDRAVWQCDQHIGYTCGNKECSSWLAKG